MTEFKLLPREIVNKLNEDIVGHEEAKKIVAIAIRNRYRRKNVSPEIRDEIIPKNILMIGSTGVGKTEIARRLAKMVSAPFIKVEATKFTEIGYVGRDVDSIIRDLVEIAITQEKNIIIATSQQEARKQAEEIIINKMFSTESISDETRAIYLNKLRSGELDETEIEIEVKDTSSNDLDLTSLGSGSIGMLNVGDMIGKVLGDNNKIKRKLPIRKALEVLTNDKCEDLVDMEIVKEKALKNVEEDGIVFIDEIDKVIGKGEKRAEVNREGVQRDLLPLIEGTSVSTKYGSVKTDHILFIASGAFHVSRPSDMLPELQGRLPTRVQLNSLTYEDMVRILKEPRCNLIAQYQALIGAEDIQLSFSDAAIKEIARIAIYVNENIEDIGARRLHTLLEKLLEEINFEAGDSRKNETIKIDKKYVNSRLDSLTTVSDLSKFIL